MKRCSRISVLIGVAITLLIPASRAERPAPREIGCFAENRDADPIGTTVRDLDGAAFKDPSMTRELCLSLCSEQGFRYAGLQDGSWCFCGDRHGRYGQSGANCAVKCGGDPDQYCGGKQSNSIWDLLGTRAVAPSDDGPPSFMKQSAPAERANAPGTAAKHDFVAEEVVLPAAVIPVGKWPEGLAYDGKSLWVAESGQRRIARIDTSRLRVDKRIKVGRLPVGMQSGENGRIYALVHTDKKVWRQRGRSGRTIARIPQCPEAMTRGSGKLYILTWIDCASSFAAVYAVDEESGKVEKTADMGSNAFGITSAGESVWVLHTTGERATLVRFIPGGENQSRLTLTGLNLHRMASNGERVFASGSRHGKGVVVAFDEAGGDRYHRQVLPQPVFTLAATPDYAIAVGDAGTIWVLSADNLGIIRTIRTDYGPFGPKSALALDGSLYVAISQGQGENGSVLVIDAWQPEDPQASPAEATSRRARWVDLPAGHSGR